MVLARRAGGMICGLSQSGPGTLVSGDLCDDTSAVAPNTGGAWAVVANVVDLSLDCSPLRDAAHEIGHTLGLKHGDGIDNEPCNGRWDELCDGSEPTDQGMNLMTSYAGPLVLTDLQRDRARIFATKSLPSVGGSLGQGCPAPAPQKPFDDILVVPPVPPPPPPVGGCGCVLSPANDVRDLLISRWVGWLAILGAALALTRRRRQ